MGCIAGASNETQRNSILPEHPFNQDVSAFPLRCYVPDASHCAESSEVRKILHYNDFGVSHGLAEVNLHVITPN